MTEQELIELLADKEHDSWSRWMQHLFSKCKMQYVHLGGNAGNILFAHHDLVIPADYVKALQEQIDTPYDLLPEREKQYDRDEVQHILPIIRKFAEEYGK